MRKIVKKKKKEREKANFEKIGKSFPRKLESRFFQKSDENIFLGRQTTNYNKTKIKKKIQKKLE